jgi:hypothetical protein
MSAESMEIVEELIQGWYAVKIWKSIAFEYDDELELNQYDLYTVIVKNQDGLIVAEGGDTILSEAIDTAYRNTLEMEERSNE